jgi:hypothetical protein
MTCCWRSLRKLPRRLDPEDDGADLVPSLEGYGDGGIAGFVRPDRREQIVSILPKYARSSPAWITTKGAFLKSERSDPRRVFTEMIRVAWHVLSHPEC